MLLDVAAASAVETYKLLIGAVVPRPIAWVTTLGPDGAVNLAPFSFFNTFGGHPPVVVFAPALKRDGSRKDTLRNIEATGEFVVNVATERCAEEVNLSSKELPYGASEVDLAGLALRESVRVKPPRLVESPVNLECRLIEVKTIERQANPAILVIGEVVVFHIDDAVLGPDGLIDPARLQAIGRLGGNF